MTRAEGRRDMAKKLTGAAVAAGCVGGGVLAKDGGRSRRVAAEESQPKSRSRTEE